MNYRQARIFCFCVAIISLLLCVSGLAQCIRNDEELKPDTAEQVAVSSNQESKALNPIVVNKALTISPKVQNLGKQFSDLNDAHLSYATKIGIEPIESSKDILKLNRPIREILTCEHYYVESLTHSHPFLIDAAANLLDTIGAKFNEKLSSQNGGKYKIKVTSLLRTRESVKRLQRGNVNSTDNSAHLYGTTFDISYAKFYESPDNMIKHNDGQLKNLLAEVLIELREQGKCLVKFERKQGCFHITATGKM